MKAALPAVGCIGLFGGGPTLIARGAIPSLSNIQASMKTTAPHNHVAQLQSNAERDHAPVA